ncbi:MAG: 1-phosphofructokinase, partial [Acidobacteria bacterium]|nr:1-phosphofructokinase [Acidobacteriota bacterium]
GVEADFYARVIAALHAKYGAAAPKVAVDSSSLPLAKSIVAGLDLIKPNGEELAELLGLDDVEALEASPEATADAAQQLVDRGVGAVLATMGAKGAVLVTREGRWFAQAPKIEARSTVGAGDCSLAGYLLSDTNGGSSPAALRQAVAHGSAAASLPGTTVPALSETFPEAVTVTDLARAKEF